MEPKPSRRIMTRDIFLLIVTMTWLVTGDAGGIKAKERLFNLEKLEMFVDKLPHIPTLHGYHFVNGFLKPKSLHIGMFLKKWKFHRDLPATPVFAYGTSRRLATVPGPTIEAVYGVDTYVTWRNYLPLHHILPWDPTISPAIPKHGGIPTVVHLHGGIHEPTSDGNADSWFTADFKETGSRWTKKTTHYVNKQQPGNMWYHDHALGLTRVNLLAGLLGAYILRHSSVESPLRLPTGREFDRPLVIFDRSFRKDGSIYMNATGNNPSIHPQWQPEYFGDAIIVNGKAWPRLTVRRRKYRFRITNASNARFFRFFFSNGLEFIVVGSDSAYLAKPVSTKSVLLAPSEIVDVVVDFSKSTSKTAILANNAPYPYPSGDPVTEENSKVMKFKIKNRSEVDTSTIPKKLIDYPPANVSTSSRTRYIAMFEYVSSTDEPTHLYINGLPYNAPVTETPKIGTSEVWEVINLTEDNHPLHIHLGLFKVLEQTALVNSEEFTDCMTKENDAIKCQISKYARGNKTAVTVHERGWKNVFKMMPGHVTKILVRFSYIHSNDSYSFDATQEPGYVYHCHILDHEDNMMMRPFAMVL
ncbi:multi-copper oxidase type I family protein [Arabidopsis lyrata subsp. lyrata]|uniref:Multi-copper oxidase type I family protein n=1 Tax=Arabidopsis lyrata subsp. lyrata TaxID=81972 RepID=D7KYI0_ARALL|nr:multi-copper oxidase type I family protein [Arabidopsis lyrata subsp. lyrata]